MPKDKLIKRLEWYYPTEKYNAWLFAGITLYVFIAFEFSNSFFLIYGLLLMTFILFQGQHYWKLKLYLLKNKEISQAKNLKLFRMCKKINTVMIAIIPVLLLLQWIMIKDNSDNKNLILWGLLANLIGLLEHINYYYRQLMIDNLPDLMYVIRNKTLKVASLKKDIEEGRL